MLSNREAMLLLLFYGVAVALVLFGLFGLFLVGVGVVQVGLALGWWVYVG